MKEQTLTESLEIVSKEHQDKLPSMFVLVFIMIQNLIFLLWNLYDLAIQATISAILYIPKKIIYYLWIPLEWLLTPFLRIFSPIVFMLISLYYWFRRYIVYPIRTHVVPWFIILAITALILHSSGTVNVLEVVNYGKDYIINLRR